jgi:hypothetical protein
VFIQCVDLSGDNALTFTLGVQKALASIKAATFACTREVTVFLRAYLYLYGKFFQFTGRIDKLLDRRLSIAFNDLVVTTRVMRKVFCSFVAANM